MEAWCIGVKPCEWPSSSRVWVSAGVRTWSEGKGPANAEWQFIIPDRYISICPAAPCLPLWACCHHQAFQQRWTHTHTQTWHKHTEWHTLRSKQSLGAESNQNRGYRVPQGMSSNCDSFLICAYLSSWHKAHIWMQKSGETISGQKYTRYGLQAASERDWAGPYDCIMNTETSHGHSCYQYNEQAIPELLYVFCSSKLNWK